MNTPTASHCHRLWSCCNMVLLHSPSHWVTPPPIYKSAPLPSPPPADKPCLARGVPKYSLTPPKPQALLKVTVPLSTPWHPYFFPPWLSWLNAYFKGWDPFQPKLPNTYTTCGQKQMNFLHGLHFFLSMSLYYFGKPQSSEKEKGVWNYKCINGYSCLFLTSLMNSIEGFPPPSSIRTPSLCSYRMLYSW
jgi:hypothetical protein